MVSLASLPSALCLSVVCLSLPVTPGFRQHLDVPVCQLRKEPPPQAWLRGRARVVLVGQPAPHLPGQDMASPDDPPVWAQPVEEGGALGGATPLAPEAGLQGFLLGSWVVKDLAWVPGVSLTYHCISWDAATCLKTMLQ